MPTKTKKPVPLTLEQEIALTEAYFFALERGFTKADGPMIKAYENMIDSFELRFKEKGYKHKNPSKKIGFSVITLWRRFKTKVWKKEKQVTAFLRLLHEPTTTQ